MQKTTNYWKKNAGNNHTAAREKHLIRLVKQARLRSFRVAVKYKFGYEVPKTYARALELDTIAGNHKWRDANLLEHKKLAQYKVFKDKGRFSALTAG